VLTFWSDFLFLSSDRLFDAQWIVAAGRDETRLAFADFSKFMRNLRPSHLRAVQTDIELGLRKARLIAGDGTEEERRERLERTPISLVVEGEAFSVFFPDKVARERPTLAQMQQSGQPLRERRMFGHGLSHPHAEDDEDDFSEPEVLLLRETFFELASLAKSVICCRLTPSQKGRIVSEFKAKGHITLAIGDGGNDEAMSVNPHCSAAVQYDRASLTFRLVLFLLLFQDFARQHRRRHHGPRRHGGIESRGYRDRAVPVPAHAAVRPRVLVLPTHLQVGAVHLLQGRTRRAQHVPLRIRQRVQWTTGQSKSAHLRNQRVCTACALCLTCSVVLHLLFAVVQR
jgi:hypothetical protein